VVSGDGYLEAIVPSMQAAGIQTAAIPYAYTVS
jgi:hypothetical protein